MKNHSKKILLLLFGVSLILPIAYSSFMIYRKINNELEPLKNTFSLILNFPSLNNSQESTIIEVYEDLEEDSLFSLPIVDYDNYYFGGWSLYEDGHSTFDTSENNSIKKLKENFPNEISIVNNSLNLYAVLKDVPDDQVLLRISDNSEVSNSVVYYLKIGADVFELFNISYIYPTPFIVLKIDNNYLSINDTFDFSAYGGQIVDIEINRTDV